MVIYFHHTTNLTKKIMLNNKINIPIEDTACLHAFKYINMMFSTTLIQVLLFH